MTIEELLKTTGAKVSLGTASLYWLSGPTSEAEKGEWAVTQSAPHQRKETLLYAGDLGIALEVLKKMGTS